MGESDIDIAKEWSSSHINTNKDYIKDSSPFPEHIGTTLEFVFPFALQL